MRDLMAELKELRLHGVAQAWEELAAQGEASTASCFNWQGGSFFNQRRHPD